MDTNLNNLIFLSIIHCVLITLGGVYCNKVEFVLPVELVFGNLSENAVVEDRDISQSRGIDSSVSSEDLFLSTAELAKKYGYDTEVHSVTTKDGYILELIEITGKGPVVFLMHGTLGSSDDFVVSGPDKALAYLLADAGYHVWLGNARGNKYSRNHIFLDPELQPFWEFSWHEIGIRDVPVMVDHALTVCGAKQLTYIGHGQGTTVFFVLNSEKPEYKDKFNLMISLGTVAWTWHIRSPVLQALVPTPDSQFQLLENLGYYEIFPYNPAAELISSRYCCTSRRAVRTCLTPRFYINGFDYDQIDYEFACAKLTHFPSGSSLRQLQHYIQLARSREFAHFDFGSEGNLDAYGSPTPPPYDVEHITVPIAIFYGANDWVSSFDDTLILIQRLPNIHSVNRVPHSRFNHFDFIYAKDANDLVYWKIIDIIDEVVGCNRKASKCFG